MQREIHQCFLFAIAASRNGLSPATSVIYACRTIIENIARMSWMTYDTAEKNVNMACKIRNIIKEPHGGLILCCAAVPLKPSHLSWRETLCAIN